MKSLLFILFLFLSFEGFAQRNPPAIARWWKGNLHTHTLWSDGDDFPEMVVNYYKTNHYNFLGISDHNILLEGEKWVAITNANVKRGLAKYQSSLGANAKFRESNKGREIRLRGLDEFRGSFEKAGKFLLIPSEEISDKYLAYPVHINATNPKEFIKPQGGTNVLDVMQRNVFEVLRQREETGRPMFPHLNHPNFGWGVTAEELMRVKGEKFFEVYNGHADVRNDGDKIHPNTDKIWDVILTRRLNELDGEPLYGLGVDDSHHYHHTSTNTSNPGRGWVMVRAKELTPRAIIKAMEEGDFYASSGVELRHVRRTPKSLSLHIVPKPGLTYRTLFIGTRKGFDPTNRPVEDKDGNRLKITHQYSADVGAILGESTSLKPSYRARGDELYVRAKIISSQIKQPGYRTNEFETAWTQPIFVQKHR
jgi:hypothetical protein